MIGCVRYIVYRYEIKYNSTVSSSEQFSRSELIAIDGPFSGLMNGVETCSFSWKFNLFTFSKVY